MKPTRLCSISECGRKHFCRGWCRNHYQQWWSTGDPIPTYTKAMTFEERMARHSRPAGECQVWMGPRSKDGYGRMTVDGVTRVVHVAVWEREHGPVPLGMKLDHTCHNEPCHKLGHLRLVTHKQNLENRAGAPRNSSTGVRGVYLTRSGRYMAHAGHLGRKHYGGLHDSIEEAEAAAIALRARLFTHSDGR